MKFYARNPQTSKLFQFREKDFTLTLNKLIDRMEPRELELTVGRAVPIKQFAEIIAVENSIPIFRGYVETYEIDSKREKSLTVVGAEGWLNRRSCISYFYKEGTTFQTLFSDTLTDGVVPGLLAVANSALPPGLDYEVYAADNQIKIPGGGRASRLSTNAIYSVDYRYANQVDESVLLADLTPLDNVYYRDDDDLYIKLDNHYQYGWADLGGILVENAFDTSVRLGDDAGKALSGPLQVTQDDKIGDLIVDTALGHGYHVRMRDDWSHTYLDFLNTDGRETGYYFFEKDLEEINKSIPDDTKVHCLVGKGVGNQYFSSADLSYTGFWNQDTYEVEHGFKDSNGILQAHTEDRYNYLQKDWQWQITLRNKNVLLGPGDYVYLKPNHEAEEYLSCQKIEYSSGGLLTLELGAKRPTNTDSWEVMQGLDRAFTDRYLRELHESITQSTTFYPADPAHSSTAGSLAFSVPDGVLDASKRPRITLSLSLSPSTSVTDISYGRVAVTILIGSAKVRTGHIVATTIGGESLPEIDVTDYITAGASNTAYISAYMATEYGESHVAATGHPQIGVSGTMKFYQRGEMA